MTFTCQCKMALRQHVAGLLQEVRPQPVEIRCAAQLLVTQH